VEMAEVALTALLLLLVALQARRFLGQEVAGERLRVVDRLVADEAVDVGLLVALVREEDLVARGGAADDRRRGGAGDHATQDEQGALHRNPPGRPAGIPKW